MNYKLRFDKVYKRMRASGLGLIYETERPRGFFREKATTHALWRGR